MKHFSQLFAALDLSNKTNDKVKALTTYFATAEDIDKLYALALFTGKRPKRTVSTTLLKQWAIEWAQIPEWLFVECYSEVGDLGEVISLLLPEPKTVIDKPLHIWIQEIGLLKDKTEDEKKGYILKAWQSLSTNERFIFNKLIGGSFRVGVSTKLIVQALSNYTAVDKNVIMHSIMGSWRIEQCNFDSLIRGAYIQADNSKPYPFCLAYPLDTTIENLGVPDLWQVEYKWDGIRGQIIKRNNEVYIWSRGEELVTTQFPELYEGAKKLPKDIVLDGEIVVVDQGVIQNFNQLQKRLNRKTISSKMLSELPVCFYAYDVLEIEGADIREETLSQRREILEQNIHSAVEVFVISKTVEFHSWEELANIRKQSRNEQSEGLMLKRKDSIYHAGRKRGDWWKWKVEPLTMDAVLIYAQKGSGRRSGHYTDFTFAIRDNDKLVTIAKAYSGLTDREIAEVSKYVKENSIEKFGPVRTVKPELVFEIAFEGIGYSSRHKSGIAVRFPRIVRWRKDKTVKDIDTVESVKSLIT